VYSYTHFPFTSVLLCCS